MAYQFFTIPMLHSESVMSELNQFIASHRILEIDRQFYTNATQGYWLFCIQYTMSQVHNKQSSSVPMSKVDYREKLSEEDFIIFAKLREERKTIAEEQSIPLFAILNNRQLSEMAEQRVISLNDLRKINGIGEKKIQNYGLRLLKIMHEFTGVEPQNELTKADVKITETEH